MQAIPPVSSNSMLRSKRVVRSSALFPNQGFALVIALSLMAFVLLLLLSITTLVRVETSVSQQGNELLLARQNALLGVQVALGNLQVAAGPDQRVTASGAIVPGVDSSAFNYTTVWDATTVSAVAPIKWLVSSKDPVNFDPTAGASGDWPMLVSARNSDVVDAVHAEPVDIEGANAVVGEYAWWIGDEGVKAKVNVVEAEDLVAAVDTEERLRVSYRSGVEAWPAIDEASYLYQSDADFRNQLSRTSSASQIEIIDADLAAGAADHYHDLTVSSRSLLVDVKNGGLLQDLTYIAEGGSGSPTGSLFDGSVYEFSLPDTYHRITWEQFQSYYGLAANTGANQVSAQAPSATQYGVAPTLVMLHLNFAVTLESNYDGSASPVQTPAEREYTMYHHIRPWFVLSNPYNVTLTAENYRIRMQSTWLKIEDGIDATDDPILKDLLEHMIFTVPSVELAPGEAKIYTLDYDNRSAYGYEFQIANDNYYTEYSGYKNEQSQQFVFVESFDAGLATIRLSATNGISGADMERADASIPGWLGPPQAIQPFIWKLSSGGSIWVRTYLGDSDSLSDTDVIVQSFGPMGFGAVEYTGFLGYWPVSDLPNTVYEKVFYPSSEPSSVWQKRNLIPGGGSIVLILNGASNNSVNEAYFTSNGGWASDLNFRSSRVLRDVSGEDSGSYRFSVLADGSRRYRYWTEGTNVQGPDPTFPWGSGYAQSVGATGPVGNPRRAILFDLPRLSAFAGYQPALVSLGQLQHFNTSGYADSIITGALLTDLSGAEAAYAPAYAIGNSYASPFVPRDAFLSAENAEGYQFLDLSYALNDVLFNGFFSPACRRAMRSILIL